MRKSAKRLVMPPLYRQRVVKAKQGKGSYSRQPKPRSDDRGFVFGLNLRYPECGNRPI